jgi:hypothetical protein
MPQNGFQMPTEKKTAQEFADFSHFVEKAFDNCYQVSHYE